jgi:hypothetical protein
MARTDAKLKAAIEAKAKNKTITCPQALQIAKDLKMPGPAVRKALDGMNIKIKKCQLGCFE